MAIWRTDRRALTPAALWPHLVKGGLLGQTRGTVSEATTNFDSAYRDPMWPQHATWGTRARLLACTASLRLRPLLSTFLTLPTPCPRCIHPAEVSLTLLYHFIIILSCRAQRTSSLRRLAPPFPATRSGTPTFAHNATYQQWLFVSLWTRPEKGQHGNHSDLVPHPFFLAPFFRACAFVHFCHLGGAWEDMRPLLSSSVCPLEKHLPMCASCAPPPSLRQVMVLIYGVGRCDSASSTTPRPLSCTSRCRSGSALCAKGWTPTGHAWVYAWRAITRAPLLVNVLRPIASLSSTPRLRRSPPRLPYQVLPASQSFGARKREKHKQDFVGRNAKRFALRERRLLNTAVARFGTHRPSCPPPFAALPRPPQRWRSAVSAACLGWLSRRTQAAWRRWCMRTCSGQGPKKYLRSSPMGARGPTSASVYPSSLLWAHGRTAVGGWWPLTWCLAPSLPTL